MITEEEKASLYKIAEQEPTLQEAFDEAHEAKVEVAECWATLAKTTVEGLRVLAWLCTAVIALLIICGIFRLVTL